MIGFDDVCRRYRLERVELTYWCEERWIRPHESDSGPVFDEADLARIELIRELRVDLMVNDEAIPVVLSLLDQLYATRRVLRGLNEVLDGLPSPLRDQIRAKLEDTREP